MNRVWMERAVEIALSEDIGHGDITTHAVVPTGTWASARIYAKEPGVIAGLSVAAETFCQVDPAIQFQPELKEGDRATKGAVVAAMEGPARSLLTGERTVLNFLQRMSGIATMTSAYVRACEGTKARIVDTRKTAPGLRSLDKYAVQLGGASNHRWGLYDGILIKENHVRAGGGIARAVAAARQAAPHTLKVEIECDTLELVDQALGAGADIILLDNMSTVQMAEAVRRTAGRALLEASGNMTLERIPEVARTGVDLISVGGLTHSVRALDLSLQFVSWQIPGEMSA